MSSDKPKFSKKQRYIIAGIVLAIGVSIAFYNAQINFPYLQSKSWNFDSYQNGTIPEGFSYLSSDKTASWIVKSESTAPSKPNVLEFIPYNDSASNYHLLVMPDSPSLDNANVTVKFKIVSGEKAKSAGMIIRFIDQKHYFVLMADSVANRLSLCKQTPDFLICNYEKKVIISSGNWHTLNAIVSSQGVAASLDGNVIIRSNDHNYVTGQIGLWSKMDTRVYFDDFKINY